MQSFRKHPKYKMIAKNTQVESQHKQNAVCNSRRLHRETEKSSASSEVATRESAAARITRKDKNTKPLRTQIWPLWNWSGLHTGTSA